MCSISRIQYIVTDEQDVVVSSGSANGDDFTQLAPPQQQVQTPQGGLNGIFETMQCFSGDMEVETPSGSKAIKDLEVGDMVLSIDESMESFKPLKLTENHLMYVTDCNPSESFRLVPAKEARVGQCVQVTESVTSLTPRRIISIKRVAGVGIYAPLTSTGDIMVNRFLVSCHSNLALKTLQQTFFSVYRGLSGLLRDYFPKKFHDDAHLPFGVHYLTTIVDLFLPSSFL
ncbi:hint module [Ancylostoma duodenale]|uniref:Hint module n=1 Tax=Ancylostoma duodenale TaxID=51022 RepID=A0A0C2H9F4_9BILA|nr:hint module [Ancylostoma duodenale]